MLTTAFSSQAQEYEIQNARNPIVRWARAQVVAAVQRCGPPPAQILEINAGTGADAAQLAGLGYAVHATDIAPGMLAQLQTKIAAQNYGGRLTMQACSFTTLEQVTGGPYDLVLSNFGGLNCIADLSGVAGQLPQVLRPGGWVVWVIMPPLCPWEMAQALRGQWRTATRRWARGGTLANVGGEAVPVFYHTPAQVWRALGPQFQRRQQLGLGVFSPPAYLENFARRFPKGYATLAAWDVRLGPYPPFNGWGDYVIYRAQFQP